MIIAQKEAAVFNHRPHKKQTLPLHFFDALTTYYRLARKPTLCLHDQRLFPTFAPFFQTSIRN